MTYTITITLVDDTEKEFTIGSDVELPTGLNLTVAQVASLMNALNSLTTLMGHRKLESGRG